ncbi:hypothetical protein [Carnobacterium sp. TMP28]|uniref:DUF7305 domain-containing protein n=1 Tax=Carnobacterium sp. TMP28 TaxID=3397060 RepID=UPI0039E1AFCC
MKIKHLLKKEEGSGLVLTLMVLSVLSILSLSIGALTVGTYRLSGANRDATSAYYIAEAGATAAYDEIQNEVLRAYDNNQTRDSFYNQVSAILASKNGDSTVNFDSQFGSEPTAKIQINEENPQKYTIYSTGSIDGKERTVKKQLTTTWVEKTTSGGGLPEILDNAALMTQGLGQSNDGTKTIDIFGSSKLVGDIHTNSIESGSIKISGNPKFIETKLHYPSELTPVAAKNLIIRENNGNWLKNHIAREQAINFGAYQSLLNQAKEIIYNPADFKVLPDKTLENNNGNTYKVQDNGNLFVDNYVFSSYKLEVNNNIYFTKIIVAQDKLLEIDPMGGNHTILVDDLAVTNGKLDIIGEGSITLVIKNQVKFSQKSEINVPGTSNQLSFIYKGSSPNFTHINKMNANILAIGNNNAVQMGNTTINGVVLTDNKFVYYDGSNPGQPSNMVVIAPNAAVSLSGSYELNGTVIANTFTFGGNARLTYAKIDTTGFPFGSSRPVTDPNPEDIINSGVIIED